MAGREGNLNSRSITYIDWELTSILEAGLVVYQTKWQPTPLLRNYSALRLAWILDADGLLGLFFWLAPQLSARKAA